MNDISLIDLAATKWHNNKRDDALAHVDVTAPPLVEVQISADRKIIWVNVNGVCTLRACSIGQIVIDQQGSPT